MLGAIAGDIIGSVYEVENIRTTDFPLFVKESRFTDDTVLTVALADSILHGADYADSLKEYYNFYPQAGYGGSFIGWAASPSREPYNSWGNGSAMRVSPVGFAFDSLDTVLDRARESAAKTHNHPEGIKGAQATASAIFLARTGKAKEEIRKFIEDHFGYSMDECTDSLREHYQFDVSCQGSVPQAITAFLESENFIDAIRRAISIGGDSDTIACIAGGIAHAYYKEIPESVIDRVYQALDSRLSRIVKLFCDKFSCH
ncbi:crystallin [Candidatus Nitromaritima sp. SCGC AAA799-A02]|nr:crystallin [Candidatus Nitromaritima sp. SCGC AAA799-A02]KMP12204.1 crystallin [Candidatus Nitromaritima sp. SCGC AAA799-C22]